jgi:4-hydroxyphenylacetate 3-hydroxylase C terminal
LTGKAPYKFESGFLQRRVLCEPLFNARQTGLDKQQAVQEKPALLACYREGINAHLMAAIAMAEEGPGGLLMPNQSLLHSGRVLACSQLNTMMHVCRELCGGQICVTSDLRRSRTQKPHRGSKNTTRSTRIGGRGPSAPARLRARPAQLRLCRSPADLPALRPVDFFCPPRRGLAEFSTGTYRSASSTNPRAEALLSPGSNIRHRPEAASPGPSTGLQNQAFGDYARSLIRGVRMIWKLRGSRPQRTAVFRPCPIFGSAPAECARSQHASLQWT